MEIENSSMWREVTKILNAGDPTASKPVHYSWTAQIHVNGEKYLPLKVISIDILSDYEDNYADVMMVRISIMGGMYASYIYPSKENIEITLFRNPLEEVGDIGDPEEKTQTERYRATLIDKGNPIVESNNRNPPTTENLDLTSIVEVDFQLVNKTLEQMRMISIGGNYRNATAGDVIKGLLTRESKNVKVEGVKIPKGVDMVDKSNPVVRDHIIFPHGTPLVQVPHYVHNKCGGVYSAGLGYYFFNDYWYVYPCYDTTRFNLSNRTKLTVLNIPKDKLPSVERTYRLNGKNLIILATGAVKFSDDSEVQQLNAGNGVRFANADVLMGGGFSVTKNNKTVASRGTNNNEFVSTPRTTGNNLVRVSNNEINANVYLETSKLAKRQGSFFTFEWENSNPTLIFPGMVVKIMYLDNDLVKTVDGVLLKAHTYIGQRGEGMTATRHIAHSVLSIFVQRIQSA